MNGIVKAKCVFVFSAMKTDKEIKSQIELTDHHLAISLQLQCSAQEMIHNIFSPLYITQNGSLNINYSLIKAVQVLSESESITIDVFNPVMKVDFSFTLKHFETSSLMFKKKMSLSSLHLLGLTIQQRKDKETHHLIQKIIQLIVMLKDSLDPHKEANSQIESLLCQSYSYGRSYYEKYISIYKSNLKIKKGIKKQLNEKLKMLDSMMSEQEQIKKNLAYACFDSLLNELKIRTSAFLEESILVFFQVVSLENQILDLHNADKVMVSDNLRTLKEEYPHYQTSEAHLNKSVLQRRRNLISKAHRSPPQGHFQQEESTSKANRSCNNISHSTTVEALDRLNQSSHNDKAKSKPKVIPLLNNTSSYANTDNQTVSISTKNTSKKKEQETKKPFCYAINSKDILETPKFNSNNNLQYKYLKTPHDNNHSSANKHKEESMLMVEIMNQINRLIKKHTYVPPVDVYNIFANTSEIIHRKFFELCFEQFLGKLFAFETDNDNLIKIDSMYNYFLYLRGVKNFLFVDKNQLCFTSMLY